MHMSKLAGFIIDCQTDDLAVAADFWSQALGMEKAPGAKRVAQVQTWWVMEAPTGQRFCVVRKSSANFDERARRWP